MNFLALISALALCYYFPHSQSDGLQRIYKPYAHWLGQRFSDELTKNGTAVWLPGVLLPVLAVALMDGILLKIHVFLVFLLNVAVLYFCLGFSHFGQRAEHIASALRDKNIDLARRLSAEWNDGDTSAYRADEIARTTIEATLKHAHFSLFAPILWFVLLGLAGALLFRLAHLFYQQWPVAPAYQHWDFFTRAFNGLNWLPARVTAGCFAIVGDFEDAVYCWRSQAPSWPDQTTAIVLASGAGALGVKLGEPLFAKGVLHYRPELGLGDEADADYLQSAVGLVWRVIITMAGLMFLLTFANWLGD